MSFLEKDMYFSLDSWTTEAGPEAAAAAMSAGPPGVGAAAAGALADADAMTAAVLGVVCYTWLVHWK